MPSGLTKGAEMPAACCSSWSFLAMAVLLMLSSNSACVHAGAAAEPRLTCLLGGLAASESSRQGVLRHACSRQPASSGKRAPPPACLWARPR